MGERKFGPNVGSGFKHRDKKKGVTNVFHLDADWQIFLSCKLSSVIEIIFSPFWAASQPLVIIEVV